MSTGNEHQELPAESGISDARQSATALEIQRGAGRILFQYGFTSLTEMSLPNGRRADVIGINETGDIWIVEIKSSIEDFRADQKWPEYRDFCDRLFFAVKPDFPVSILPQDTGLILADRFGGEVARDAPEIRLAGARRKSMTLRFARAGASRLMALTNPTLANLIGTTG